MKRRLIYFLVLGFLFPYSKVFSQQKDTTLQLEEVVVSTGRIPTKYLETGRSITTISAAELQDLPVLSIADVLENFAGVDVRQRGIGGVQADVSIRGENFENVLILLNGVAVNDPQTGHHNLNLPVSPEQIERIEILRGPAARIHGQNAFSGVINFITKKPADANISATAVVGDFDFFRNSLSISAPIKKFKQNFSASRTSSNGYRHNTDFGINHFFYQAYMDVNENVAIMADAGFSDKNYGANAFYAAFPDQWEATQTTFAHISAETKGKWRIKPNIYWRKNTDEFLLKRDNPAFYRNFHTTNVFGADINASRSWKAGITSIGATGRNEQIVSTNLGNHQRNNAGIFAEHRMVFGDKLTINPGFFLSWYSDYDVQWYPGIDISYLLTKHFSVYATANRSYRVPTYTELYYKDVQNLANPNLKPEEAMSYEVGFRKQKAGFSLSAAIFEKQGKNIIDWNRASDSLKWQVMNFASLNTRGAEAMLSLNPAILFGKDFIIQKLSAQYTYLQTDKENTELLSKYVLDYLQNQLIFGLQHKLPFGTEMRWQIRCEDRIGYKSYWLVDARLFKNFKQCSLFAEASNLFNHQYFEISNIPMPGRWASGGISFHLK